MADTAIQQPPNPPKTPKSIKKKAPVSKKPETPEMPSRVEETSSQVADTAETNGEYEEALTEGGETEEEAKTETAEHATNGEAAEEDDDAAEAIQAGSVDHDGNVVDTAGNIIGRVTGENASQLEGSMVDQEGDILDEEGNVIGQANLEEAADKAKSEVGSKVDEAIDLSGPFGVQDNGDITNATGVPVGKLLEGDPQDLVGTSIKDIDSQGNLVKESGSIIGKAEVKPELLEKAGEAAPSEVGSKVDEAGDKLDETAPTDAGSKVDEAGDKLDQTAPTDAGSKVDEVGDKLDEAAPTDVGSENPKDVDADVPDAGVEVPDLSILEGKKVNKLGKIVDDQGTPWGVLVEGDAKKLAGKKVDKEGKIWDDTGKVIGRVELLPESERPDVLSSPFEDFPDAILDKSGNVIYEGQIIGKLVEGDAKKLAGKKVDADGDILDKHGNVLGKVERSEDEEPAPEPEPEAADLSELEGKKVNKAGNIVDDNGKLFGKLVTGDASKLVGKKCDAEGKIYSDSGKVIGTAELLPMDDREAGSESPFEDFPDATVDKNGNIVFDSVIVGKLIEGDAKKLLGKKIDKDGEIVDKIGNVIGKAERWEEEEALPEAPIDMSILAGKRVNKVGNVVDSSGQIFGRIVEGDPKKLAGKMCDKNGQIWDDGGKVVGQAELVPESEREGQKEGPFAGFDSPTVTKDGKVADSHGAIIGKIVSGDAKVLYGKQVDPDGDVLDRNGNTLGKAERWEEEEKAKVKHPAAGRKVNKAGDVVDENGDVIAKLTDGTLQKCAGKEIDDDGDVVDGKGTTVGHVTLLEDIPEPEPEPVVEEPKESEEEIAERKQLEQDRKLAGQLAQCIDQSLESIKPILKMITDAIDQANAQPKEELDEQKLVDTVKPLIEQGGAILQEANGAIRAMDPDGRIQANAKHKTAAREATPEEYRLADLLKELTGTVTQTIDGAKKKIAGMPHAKKELNPLWGLLAEPLGQILAAVGLLLAGVLGLVGRLLSGLGLGGLLDNLLGGLGLKGILKGLGLGMVTESLTGKKN